MNRGEKKGNDVEKRVDTLEATFKMFVQEMRDFKTEMRDRDKQRADDIREIRIGLDSMGKHVSNLSVAAIIGVSTIAITVIYSILSR